MSERCCDDWNEPGHVDHHELPVCAHCGEAAEVHGLDKFGGTTGPSAKKGCPGYHSGPLRRIEALEAQGDGAWGRRVQDRLEILEQTMERVALARIDKLETQVRELRDDARMQRLTQEAGAQMDCQEAKEEGLSIDLQDGTDERRVRG